jgi:GcrA cell cycle regulator
MADAGATWTDDRVELLKKLWSDGLSASQIAAEMGGVTRNAVIGKVHRLGLSGRGKTSTAGTPRPRKPRVASHPAANVVTRGNPALAPRPAPRPVTASLPDLIEEEVVVPLSERVTIMELRETMCRWPLGDPTTPEFRFCGSKCITGLPYCTYHARIAYQPAAERKRIRA